MSTSNQKEVLVDRLAAHAAFFEKIAERNLASHYEEVHARGEATRALAADLCEAILTIWQLKGALGYPVPGDIPPGEFRCGICDACAVSDGATE